MVEKIIELINSNLSKQLTLNAKKKVNNFSKEIVIPKWLKLLNAINNF